MTAGNTADSLRGIDVFVAANVANEKSGLPSAADLDEVAKEAEIAEATARAIEADPELKEQLAADIADQQAGVEYITREEYDVLLGRIALFNTRSGHKI